MYLCSIVLPGSYGGWQPYLAWGLRFSQAILICQEEYMQLVCVYFCTNMTLWCIINKPRPLGIYLCLRLKLFQNLVASHWLTGPHSTPCSQIRPKPQYILKMLLHIDEFLPPAFAWGEMYTFWKQAVRRWLTCLKNKVKTVEKQQDKNFFGDGQVLYLVAN